MKKVSLQGFYFLDYKIMYEWSRVLVQDGLTRCHHLDGKLVANMAKNWTTARGVCLWKHDMLPWVYCFFSILKLEKMIFQVLRLQHIPQLSVPHGCQVAVWQSRQKGAVQSTCGHPMLPKALQRAWPGVFFGTILTFGDCTIKKKTWSQRHYFKILQVLSVTNIVF